MQDNDNNTPSSEEPEDLAEAHNAEATAEEDPAERIAALEAELAEAKDQQLRALAEVENMRRRAQREREEALKYGAVSLARDLLSVSDNLSRALEAAPAESAEPAVQSLLDGIGMVEKELSAALDKHHVKPVAGVGEPFDHNVHQAVVELETTDVEPGSVAQVMQAGYTLHDRLLRAAMVAVAKAPGG